MEARTPLQTAEFGVATHTGGDLGQVAPLRILRLSPVCAETPLDRQRGLLTPNHLFDVRNGR
jgi:hypothetical protein